MTRVSDSQEIHLCTSRFAAICARPSTPPRRCGSAASAWARSRWSTTTPPSRRSSRARRSSAAAKNLWRYRELLPIAGEPRTGFHSGFTPLVKADRLAARLGVRELYVKDDSVNHPTCSYKDRVVSVAATRAVELGFTMFACASTGNLAEQRRGARGAARARRAPSSSRTTSSRPRSPAPASTGRSIIAVRGNYDDVNRLCTQVADRYGWGFANINLRAYYAEGAKTYGFEIAEQLGWRFPRHVVSPVAGGTLLPRILKGFEELRTVGLVEGELPAIYAAQAAGCAPVVRALEAGLEFPDPGQAEHDREVDRDRQSRGRLPGAARGAPDRRRRRDGRPTTRSSPASSCWPRRKASSPSRPAASTVAATKKLIERGTLPRDESIVICITGNGYKTAEVHERPRRRRRCTSADRWRTSRRAPPRRPRHVGAEHGAARLVTGSAKAAMAPRRLL